MADRSVPADVWRDQLAPHRQAFGVARLGRTTRLDDLGIETATAIRRDPIGISVSVSSGKGLTQADADASALGEALERYCAEPRASSPPILTARAADLPHPPIDLPSLALGHWVSDDLLEGALDWCAGVRVHDSAPVYVPAELVFFPYAPRTHRQLLVAPTTTGLAAGASRLDAILHGAFECIERDAYSRALAFVESHHGDEIPGVADTAPPLTVRERIAHLRARGFRVFLRNLTHDIGVPTVLAVIDDGELAHFGCASHSRSAVAIEAAFFEAAQSRVADLQGAREDLPPRVGRPHAWFTSEPIDTAGFVDLPYAERIEDEISMIDDRLAAAGVHRMVAVDLSIPTVPAAVVRTIVVGLEQWGLDVDRVGSRVRAWLALAPSRS
jgi:thioglycine synthase